MSTHNNYLSISATRQPALLIDFDELRHGFRKALLARGKARLDGLEVLLTLTYLVKGNPRTIAIRAVAKANNLDIEEVDTDSRKGPLSNDYLKINKLGRVPSFVGADGYELTESIAIAIYRMLCISPLDPNFSALLPNMMKDQNTVIPDRPFCW